MPTMSGKNAGDRAAGNAGASTTLWQVLLAATLGICIGVCVNSLSRESALRKEHKELVASLDQWTKFENMQSAVQQGMDKVSKISLVPTLEKRMNLLLMGVDSNGKHTQRFVNTRSDTMIIVSADPVTKTVGMVSIPRDSRVRIAGGHGMDKINSAHAFGGADLAVQTVTEDFGVPIDHYIVVDVQGLKRLFEILGPADVLVEKKMRYTDHAAGLHVALDPGVQTLTPTQMEEYVRFRHDQKGDIGRIERQQWFLRQVSKKLRDPSVILKLPDLYKLATECVETDLSVEDMTRLAQFGKDIQSSQVKTAMLPGKASFIHGGSYWLPDGYGSAIVFNRTLGTNLTAAEAGNGLKLQTDDLSASDAYAAEVDTRYSIDGKSGERADAPVIVTIKYPKAAEKAARKLQAALTGAGYKVKYVYRIDASDCAHEQIQQCSVRADDQLTAALRRAVPAIGEWPVAMNLDPTTAQDFTIVVSPLLADALMRDLIEKPSSVTSTAVTAPSGNSPLPPGPVQTSSQTSSEEDDETTP